MYLQSIALPPPLSFSSEDDLDIVDYFFKKQIKLEAVCLRCVWNFSEIDEDRQLVLQEIGLEPFISSFLKPEDDCDSDDKLDNDNKASVNCSQL